MADGMSKAEFESRVKRCGLYVDTWSPGDGQTRYRFFTEDLDYFADNGIFTALGFKEAKTFLRGYAAHYALGQ